MKKVNSIILNRNKLKSTANLLGYKITGEVGAVFSLQVKDSSSPNKFYNFKTKAFQTTATRLLQQEIKSETKTYTTNIVFPAVTSDTGYNVYVYAESHFETKFN